MLKKSEYGFKARNHFLYTEMTNSEPERTTMRRISRIFLKAALFLCIAALHNLSAEDTPISSTARSDFFKFKTEQTASCIAVYGTSTVSKAQYDRVYNSVKSTLADIDNRIVQGMLNSKAKIIVADNEEQVENNIDIFMKHLPAEIIYVNQDGEDESLPGSSGAGVCTTELELMYLVVYYSLLTESTLSAEYGELKAAYAEASQAKIFTPGEDYQDGADDPAHQNASANNALKYGSYLFGVYKLYFGDGTGSPGEFTITSKAQLAAQNPKGYQFIRSYITRINHAPSFIPGESIIKVDRNSGIYQKIWATNIRDAVGENHNLRFNITTSDTVLFQTLPAIDATTGVLTFTIADNQTGYAKVHVTLSDDGGIADGGNDTSSEQVFTIISGSFISETVLDDESPAGLQILKNRLKGLSLVNIIDGNLSDYSDALALNKDYVFDLISMQKVIDTVNAGNNILFYELCTGWNLVHIPSRTPTDISSAFNEDLSSSVFSWNSLTKQYKIETSGSTGVGLWLFWIKEKSLKSIEGIFDKPSMNSLKDGWNLVGLPDPASIEQQNSIQSVWGWKESQQVYTLRNLFGDLEENHGYWIKYKN